MLSDHIFWFLSGVCFFLCLLYIKYWWGASPITILLNGDQAYCVKSPAPIFFRGKRVSRQGSKGTATKYPLYFEQYGNLCLYAYYESTAKNVFIQTLIGTINRLIKKPIQPNKRTRFLIPRDALSFAQYRTLQSFAARQVRLTANKSKR